jgi:hypothetical protein
VFKEFVPFGTTGFDKEGSPIIFVPFAGIDIWGILHSASKHDIIKNTIKLLERKLLNTKLVFELENFCFRLHGCGL